MDYSVGTSPKSPPLTKQEIKTILASEGGLPAGMTAEEAAEIWDDAHDLLLVDGWKKGGWNGVDGERCLHQAIFDATLQNAWSHQVAAQLSQMMRVRGWTESWNDSEAQEDDVFESLRVMSKEARNGELGGTLA